MSFNRFVIVTTLTWQTILKVAGSVVFLNLRNYMLVKLVQTNCVIEFCKVASRDTKFTYMDKYKKFFTVLYI